MPSLSQYRHRRSYHQQSACGRWLVGWLAGVPCRVKAAAVRPVRCDGRRCRSGEVATSRARGPATSQVCIHHKSHLRAASDARRRLAEIGTGDDDDNEDDDSDVYGAESRVISAQPRSTKSHEDGPSSTTHVVLDNDLDTEYWWLSACLCCSGAPANSSSSSSLSSSSVI